METVEMTRLLNVIIEPYKYMNRYVAKTRSHNVWEKRKMEFGHRYTVRNQNLKSKWNNE